MSPLYKFPQDVVGSVAMHRLYILIGIFRCLQSENLLKYIHTDVGRYTASGFLAFLHTSFVLMFFFRGYSLRVMSLIIIQGYILFLFFVFQ
jgi:hypothetical protein